MRKLKWFSAVVENLTNGVWFYTELKARSPKHARKQLDSCFSCTSGHAIEIRCLKEI